LITKDKQVKIADFGLARVYGFCKLITSVVVTLWYRAPELLLQCPYATLVDLWSVGAIMAEMYNRRPIFPGKSDVDQLHKVLNVIGAPEEKEWPEKSSLPWENFKNCKEINLRHLVPDISPEGLDLMKKLLMFDPNKRLNARKSLEHTYFDDIVSTDSQDSGISTKSTKSDDSNASTDSGIGLEDTSSGRTLTRTDSGICVSPPPSNTDIAVSEGKECCVNNNSNQEQQQQQQQVNNNVSNERRRSIDDIKSPPRKMQRRGEYT